MLLAYLVDRLHLVDNVLAPPEQARLHKSPGTITDLPIQDSMLGLLSPPVRLLLLIITTRGLGLHLQTWMLMAIPPQLPPLTTQKTIDSALDSLGRGERVARTINLVDWAINHHNHHEAELKGNVTGVKIIS